MTRNEKVLDGIPSMSYGNPSAVCYIGAVTRLMEYLNDPVEMDELFCMSGTAFCFPWKGGMCCDEVSILPEIPRRTFAALGYESEYFYEPEITKNPRKYSEAFYRAKIKESIDRGRPVIGFGFTELNFTCLITGYSDDGNGLYLRSYWSPQGQPEGNNQDEYYQIENWYEKCYGILTVGDKVGDRLAGQAAYTYMKENASIFQKKDTETTMGQTIYNNRTAFDDMHRWLFDENHWQEGSDLNFLDCLLKPCGLLLLDHYRSYLHGYLGRLSEQHPDLVNPEIRPAIEYLGSFITGPTTDIRDLSTIDQEATDFSKILNRPVREKLADMVLKLKEADATIFELLLYAEKNVNR